MTVILHSSRFGPVEIAPEAVIEFPDGLIGLGGSRYTLLATDADSPFTWLHCVDDPQLALPVTNPHSFFADFRLELDEGEAQRLGVDDAASVDVYVTVRAGQAREDFAANLRAPIIIHRGRGHQVINHAPDHSLRAPLFAPGQPGPASGREGPATDHEGPATDHEGPATDQATPVAR